MLPFARPDEPPPRVALLDLGTNSALLSVLFADDRDRRRLSVAEEIQLVPGLGRDRGEDGSLNEASRARARAALAHFARRLDKLGVPPDGVLGAATAAMREAPDGGDFLEEIRDGLGLPLQVIGGQDEAELVALAQERSFPGRLPLLVLDIGGGSTECALRDRGHTAWKVSLPIGSVKLTERHGDDPAALRAAVNEALAGLPPLRERATLVGVAGTVTTAAQVVAGLETWDPTQLHGSSLDRSSLTELLDRLEGLSPEERRTLPGMHPGRADYAVAGVTLLLGVLERFQLDRALVSDRGVRFGLLWRRWPRAVVVDPD